VLVIPAVIPCNGAVVMDATVVVAVVIIAQKSVKFHLSRDCDWVNFQVINFSGIFPRIRKDKNIFLDKKPVCLDCISVLIYLTRRGFELG